jgi:hypothetical protein
MTTSEPPESEPAGWPEAHNKRALVMGLRPLTFRPTGRPREAGPGDCSRVQRADPMIAATSS